MIKRYKEWRRIVESDISDDELLGYLFDSQGEHPKEDWRQELDAQLGWHIGDDPQPLDIEEIETTDGWEWHFNWDPDTHGMHDINFVIGFKSHAGETASVDYIAMEGLHTSPDFINDSDMDDDEWDEAESIERENHGGVEYNFEWTAEMPQSPRELLDVITSIRPQPYVNISDGSVNDYDMPNGWT